MALVMLAVVGTKGTSVTGRDCPNAARDAATARAD